MDLELLSATLSEAGEPGYRYDQAWAWQARGAAEAEDHVRDEELALGAGVELGRHVLVVHAAGARGEGGEGAEGG